MSDRLSPRLFGRGREFAQLDMSLERALAGRGQLILLTGEPGIGKTALAREFVEHAVARGAAAALGSCWDGGGAPAYWPWVQVGRVLSRRVDLGALRDALGAGAPWIAGLLPELSAALGPPAEASELDSDQARFRLFDALATLLATVAEQRPLVVVLDDLHWADASSLLALEFVARALPEIPLLAIAAYRHAEAHARADLAAPLGGLARAATRLPLEGLGRDEVGLLAQARARGLRGDEAAPIPPQLVTAVHQASAGNPFFADELVQLLVSQGRLHDDSAAERPLPLPAGVRDAIRRRLDPLEPSVQQALAAAAVIGGEFGLHTLAAVLGEAPGTVLDRLEVPLRSGIVNARRDAGRYAFAHALVRDTLLESLGATRRARLHRAAAEALEEAYGDDLEQHLAEIAHHYLQAATEGGAERAVDYAARAAQRAVGQFVGVFSNPTVTWEDLRFLRETTRLPILLKGVLHPDDARAAALVDWDFDGRLDVWLTNRNAPRLRLMRNLAGDGHHFLALKLRGTKSNRDGVGARVEVYAGEKGDQRFIQTLRAGNGFLAQSSKWVHFGLGEESAVKRVVVVAFEGFQSLDVSGPVEVLARGGELAGDPYATTVVTVSGAPVTASPSGLRLLPDAAIADVRAPVDTLVVAGGVANEDRAARQDGLGNWRTAPRVGVQQHPVPDRGRLQRVRDPAEPRVLPRALRALGRLDGQPAAAVDAADPARPHTLPCRMRVGVGEVGAPTQAPEHVVVKHVRHGAAGYRPTAVARLAVP
ncbi:MAG: AAA family ATPase [Actinobacteria bacterium]|nr:AAA family ATPase [Actinomycetota bacterium]